MSPTEPVPATSGPKSDAERRIVEIVRDLAREVGGSRAAAAVTPTASLEREVGLGSLERVELLGRVEHSFGLDLPDRFLLLDTPRELASALALTPAGLADVTDRSRQHLAAAPSPATVRLDDVRTLAEVLRRRAAADPERVHVHLRTDDAAPVAVSYRTLWEGATRIAAGLASRGVEQGDRVGIMLPTGLEFLESFMGTLLAGAIAVPLYPPLRLDRIAEYLQRQTRILANADARLLVSVAEAIPFARLLRSAHGSRTELCSAAALGTAASRDADLARSASPVGAADDPALIQYTSGSTGDPKGVLLTHGNLLANIHAMAAGVSLRPTDAAVSWLPLYHDMGLIGAWLGALVHGIPLALMSPLAFLAHPERWLWAIHEHRATLAAAPNFAYEMCVRKIGDDMLEGLDLSSWRCALNGSEPISAGTLDRFARRFERCGFRRDALMPVYGLAESSVALCFSPVGRAPLVDGIDRDAFERAGQAVPARPDDATALTFVSVGRALPGLELRVLDDAGQEAGERRVGRIVFRGPSCMREYYRNPRATAAVTLPDGWLDSGDLGYRAGNELFVTGRVKDLIIKGGRNLVPQEIEEVAASVDGIRKGCVAAFGVTDEGAGTEQVVILAESRVESAAERDARAAAIIATVSAGIGVPPDVVRIVPPGTVPKTPGGKIRRSSARELYRSGQAGRRAPVPWRLRVTLLAAAGARRLRGGGARLARAAYLAYLAVVGTAGALLGVPLLWALARLAPSPRDVRALSRGAARGALGLALCRLTVEGRDRLPLRGPAVLVVNHASYADTPALLAGLPADVVVVAMREILGWYLIGSIVRRADHPTVDRWHAERSLADAAAIEARLRGGAMVLFFPEGGMAAASGIRPFRLGAFEAAVKVGAPVVPLALSGTRHVLRAGTRIPHRGRIHLWIGEPIIAKGTGWRASLALRDRAAIAIAAQTREPRLEATGTSAAPR
jgi:1-acyl-sn-glycerol-3-phosphate acyltransferase